MRKRVKKYLVPNTENEYKPHLLRKASVLGLAVFIGFLFIASATQHYLITSTNLSAVISSVLVDLTNTDRARMELNTLAVNPTLQDAAQRKAQDMVEKGYFAHESPEGVDPWHWFEKAGYDFAYAGENLAVNFSDSVDVENAWMNSPKHRANILNERFTEIGIATAQGTYKGQETTFVVQMFGRPAVPTTTSTPTEDSNESDEGSRVAVSSENQEDEPTESSETNVAGVESEAASVEGIQTIEQDDMFIAVKNTDATASPKTDHNATYSAWYEKALASPHTTLKYIYTILSALILLVLILSVFIEIRRQHPRHVAYGVLLLALMLALLYLGREFIFPAVLIV